MIRPKILVLTSSLLNDRMILYNGFLPTLTPDADVVIWPTAWDKTAYQQLDIKGVTVEKFPEVKPMAFKLNLLRRIVDYTWDAKRLSTSRKSFWKYTRLENAGATSKFLYEAGKVINFLGLAKQLEYKAEKFYVNESRSPEAYERLKEMKPDVIVTMAPLFAIEPGIISEARKLNIPCMAFITSWDNLTTKNRIMFNYEGYVLWSQAMKRDLELMYPHFSHKPSYVVGAPQYDVFQNKEYYLSREEFCSQLGLDPAKPIVLYALGSPNLFNEFPGAVEFAKRAANGDAGDVQVIIRPHPLKFNDPGLLELKGKYKNVVIQTSNPKPGEQVYTHDKTAMMEWVSTIYHADVLIQLASTVAIDAAILDRPVINIDFDPSGEKNQLVWDLNHIMNHFAPITEANAMWEVHNYEEMVEAVKGYVANPALHHEGRKYIAQLVAGYTDGKCGDRYAQALLDFVKQHKNTARLKYA